MGSANIPFSKRTAWDLTESSLTAALRRRRAAGLPIADLTASNPTTCGLRYDPQNLLTALLNERALEYDPDPRGLVGAREAVCAYYADHQSVGSTTAPLVAPEQVLLTTSTSEAYSFLFRLLCDPGDEVLIAQPSYPLLDFLADLDDIRLVPYSLLYDQGWQLDLAGLRARLTPKTRAIAVVHPNNPTGHFTKTWEREALEAICIERHLALIVDEVFLDYPLEPQYSHESASGNRGASFATGRHSALTFVLSGLSKVAGLPQMKAAWILCLGPEGPRTEAQNRLEMIADTFLSMNAPIQAALPTWLAAREGIQRQIQRRTTANLAALDKILGHHSVLSRLRVEGGWYAVLRVPAVRSDEETALELLDSGVLVQPGYYYGFPPAGWLVISLLTLEEEFQAGVQIVVEVLEQRQN